MAEIRKLGRYEILSELGRGGMGIVLKGRDPHLDRMVALKIIKLDEMGDSMTEKELLERFYIEARAAGKIHHPHIVTVYDIGETEGKKFIAMEYVEGRNLAGIIAGEGPLPVPRAARYIGQIADALALAHENGIVHRDIKPGNILVDTTDQVKITDFGLARLQSAGSVTQTGHAVGSPSYMSPEQVQGLPVDGRSDIFSLGVMFYEMLTKKRPFEGDSLTAVIFKIIKEIPKPPSHHVDTLPQAIDRIIEKMMAKDPEDRYTSAREVARDLRQFVSPATPFPISDSDKLKTVNIKAPDVTVKIDSSSHQVEPKGKKKTGAVVALGAVAALMGVAAILILRPGGKEKETVSPASQSVVAPAQPSGAPPAVEEKPAQLATLMVTSNPSGAVVKIDGAEKGKTPLTLENLPAGRRKVELSQKGFNPSQETVALVSGEQTKLDVRLEPLSPAQGVKPKPVGLSSAVASKSPASFGAISVTAIPWANIYVNGQDMGVTPRTLEKIPEGKAEVRLVNPAYRPYKTTVSVRKDDRAEVGHIFTEAEEIGGGERGTKEGSEEGAYGSLKVSSTPPGIVFVDGKLYGRTPVSVNDIPAGTHNLVIKRAGMPDHKRKVEITPGITTNIAVE
ncbi:MAG: serine/threonine protein kinase [Nitrospinae bacterium]|nr:serine/threonine protein kinase [Nitrospinota bacterium]